MLLLSGRTKYTTVAQSKKRSDVKSKWIDYNKELLNHLFSDASEANQYEANTRNYFAIAFEAPLPERNKNFQNDVQRHVTELESIRDRLKLIPLHRSVTPSTALDSAAIPKGARTMTKKVFVVHGHDDLAKIDVARLLERLKLEPVILHEQPDMGRTIIEKFTDHAAETSFAIVLLTPDDVGYPKSKPDDRKERARQNVILELGYFVGNFGRKKVCALHKGHVEIPSDYAGVIYKAMDDAGHWKLELAKEMKAAGLPVDLNDL